jgi:hypothetical protein
MMQDENPRAHQGIDVSAPLTPPRRLFAVPEGDGEMSRMFAELDEHLAAAHKRGPEVVEAVEGLRRAVDRVAALLLDRPQGGEEAAS